LTDKAAKVGQHPAQKPASVTVGIMAISARMSVMRAG
jgi:hypothetical protein